MQQKYVQKPIKSNFIPSKFMQPKKIFFDNSGSFDKETGEIRAKEFSITCNVVDGTKANFQPKCIVTMKLGNESMKLIAEDFDTISEALYQASIFVQKCAREGNGVKAKELSKWLEIKQFKNSVQIKSA